MCPRRLNRPLSWPGSNPFSALQTQERLPQPEARGSRLRPGFAPDVSFPSRGSWILRHLPFPWDAQAAAGSTAGLFVCSCLAGMGLILSLVGLGCVLGAGSLGTLQFWLLLLPQQRCPWDGQDPGRGHGLDSPKVTKGTFQSGNETPAQV